MADPARQAPAREEPDIGQLILDAPDDVWNKIKATLKVNTREEAATMAQADAKTQRVVIQILGGGEQNQTLLTKRSTPSYVTRQRPTGGSGVTI